MNDTGSSRLGFESHMVRDRNIIVSEVTLCAVVSNR